MKKIMSFKLTIVVVILVLIGILMPGGSVPSIGIPGMDKVVHFGMFFMLTGTFYFEYLMKYKRLPRAIYVIPVIGAFAFSTEVMQLFASSRSYDLKDLLMDIIGCIVASGIWIGTMKLRGKNREIKTEK
ncbi:MAG: VanZ family protein [Cellulosilyticaceae bacterium]